MRTRFVPLIVILVVVTGTEALLGNRNEVSPTLSLRQRVDSEIANLGKNLEISKKDKEVWGNHLENTRARIKSLRAKNPRQFEPDELYMDYIYFSLRDFPSKMEFKPEKCGHYRSALIANFNPLIEMTPNPAIIKTLGLLKIICP